MWIYVYMYMCGQLGLTLCDPMDCSWPTRLLCPWHSPGKNTGVGWRALLQGIFLSQWLNQSLRSSALAGGFFTISPPGEHPYVCVCICNLTFFWLSHMACGIFVPWPGIEPWPLQWSPNHWTGREFPFLKKSHIFLKTNACTVFFFVHIWDHVLFFLCCHIQLPQIEWLTNSMSFPWVGSLIGLTGLQSRCWWAVCFSGH